MAPNITLHFICLCVYGEYLLAMAPMWKSYKKKKKKIFGTWFLLPLCGPWGLYSVC